MSTQDVSAGWSLDDLVGRSPYEWLALLSVGALSASYLAVLYHVVDVVGGVQPFVVLVVAAFGLAVGLRFLSRRMAMLVGAALLAIGLGVYLFTMPESRFVQLTLGRVAQDTAALLTGYSVLRVTNVQVWALAVTAGPTFLTWYFALRQDHLPAVVVGGLTLGFFVLTGDSGAIGTMVGVLGVAGAIGFSTLALHGATRAQGEVLAGVFAVMIIAAGTVTAVPGGASPLVPPGTTSVSGDLVSAESRVSIGGSLDLSPKVLFTVDSQEAAYWRVTAYDRFTGTDWIRTGTGGGPPERRPGYTYPLRQEITARQPLDVYPAAPTPRRVSGLKATVTSFGDLDASEPLETRQSYVVISDRPFASTREMRRAGSDYPESVEDRYLRVPDSTSGRVHDLAARITANSETPYQKAQAIETWLEANKGYSLDVRNPDGNVVDQFIFEMKAGYCVYFASTMVVMLRTQGVPARFVVGYTSGQAVGEDTYVVRGLDSHAWVEIYVPDVGWVPFDPTPSSPRVEAEHEEIRTARENNVTNVDTLGSEAESFENETETEDPSDIGGNDTGESRQRQAEQLAPFLNASLSGQGNTTGGVNATIPSIDAEEPSGPTIPPPETLALWGLVAVGLVAGTRRTRAAERAYRQLWLRFLPRGEPKEVIEGAFDRVVYLLEEAHRERYPGETVREYVTAVTNDERVHTLCRLREEATYAGRADEERAERARETIRAVRADSAAASRFSPSTMFNRLLS